MVLCIVAKNRTLCLHVHACIHVCIILLVHVQYMACRPLVIEYHDSGVIGSDMLKYMYHITGKFGKYYIWRMSHLNVIGGF